MEVKRESPPEGSFATIQTVSILVLMEVKRETTRKNLAGYISFEFQSLF